jgi:hypothetical protein
MSSGTTNAAQGRVAFAAGLNVRPAAALKVRVSLHRSLLGGLLLLIRP